MHRVLRLLVTSVVLVVVGVVYTKAMARLAPENAPPSIVSPDEQADLVVVQKSRRQLWLFREGKQLATYEISLGAAGDSGHKQREGDERTPEGEYTIDWRNPRSKFSLSLHVSYPNHADQQNAKAGGYSPGGNVMIHGLPNGWGLIGGLHRKLDWTDGCIAVTNAEIREIWAKVPNATPIRIMP